MISEKTDGEVLRIIIKIVKIRTVHRVFDEFSFQVGNENKGLFQDFQDTIDSTEPASLVKKLKKTLKKYKEEK